MSKVFIQNLDKVNPAEVRIYRVSGNAVDTIPESFTMMDMLDASFGVGLLAAPAFECVGSIPRTGGMVILGDGPYTVMSAEDTQEVTTLDAMLEVLNAVPGFRVNVLPRWSGAQIVCNGGKVESGWYNLSNNAPFELSVDGEVIGADFFFSSWGPQGNYRVKEELNKRGIDIEFIQEIG